MDWFYFLVIKLDLNYSNKHIFRYEIKPITTSSYTSLITFFNHVLLLHHFLLHHLLIVVTHDLFILGSNSRQHGSTTTTIPTTIPTFIDIHNEKHNKHPPTRRSSKTNTPFLKTHKEYPFTLQVQWQFT